MTTTITGTIEIDGTKLYYERAGAGETLVFCHAGVTDSRLWDAQWDAFSQQYEVVRFDMRGFGQSDRATGPVSRRADLDAVLNQLELKQVHLVGCSLGGEIVLDYALEHPERVRSLTLVAAVPGGFEMQGEPPAELFEMIGAIQQGAIAQASELQNRIWADGPYRQPEQVDATFRQRVGEMNTIALHNQTWLLADTEPADPLDPPAAQRLGGVQLPVLVIAGALDNSEILRAAAVMTEQIAHSQQIILADCAHLPSMEQPQAFNTALLNFLASI